MKQEQLKQLIAEYLKELDEEIRNGLYDVYLEPNNNNIYLMDSGMAYDGDDNDAYEVAQIEEQEVIHWL